MDIRHPLTELDETLLDWCDAAELPVLAVLTKADKLSRARRSAALTEVRGRLSRYGDRACAMVFSATKQIGRRELEERLDVWLGCDSEAAPAPPNDGALAIGISGACRRDGSRPRRRKAGVVAGVNSTKPDRLADEIGNRSNRRDSNSSQASAMGGKSYTCVSIGVAKRLHTGRNHL